jgi:hypothetical protein
MIMPNALYYNYCKDVVAYVDGKQVNGRPVEIYYPEREYYDEHHVKTGVHVHVHKIADTYREATRCVDKILNCTWTVHNLPAFQQAIPDPYFMSAS